VSDYLKGHVKRDPATAAVAVRTIFPDDDGPLASMTWLIATPNAGARQARTAEVDSWTDIYTPTAEGS